MKIAELICLFYLFFIALSIACYNLLIVFIIAIVWWTRIHPMFAHGYKTGKTVFGSLEVC